MIDINKRRGIIENKLTFVIKIGIKLRKKE